MGLPPDTSGGRGQRRLVRLDARVPACSSRALRAVVGTSICDMAIHPQEVCLTGIAGVVKDGILPGLYGYEAGQVAVGDMLAWFVRDARGHADTEYASLERRPSGSGPGETGLVALDWWNGNRTILADADLPG